MKRLLSGLLAGLALAPLAALGAAFEGKVTFKMTPARGEGSLMNFDSQDR